MFGFNPMFNVTVVLLSTQNDNSIEGLLILQQSSGKIINISLLI